MSHIDINTALHTSHPLRLFIFALVALMATACDRNLFFEENSSVDEEGWSMTEPVEFDMEIDDTTQYYNIFFNLRNSVNYKYSNAFFFINTTFPDTTCAADTLECPLADPSGEWYGKKSGRFVDNRYYFRRKTRFPMAGTYHFSIKHGMRDHDIEGIKTVGIRLEKTTLETQDAAENEN